jgi:hypothetical protein
MVREWVDFDLVRHIYKLTARCAAVGTSPQGLPLGALKYYIDDDGS